MSEGSGIWGHSSGSNECHAIFCIDKRINATGFLAWCVANDIVIKQIDGCYLGEVEKAFIVNAANMARIHAGGFTLMQDSILHLTAEYDQRDRRRAYLAYRDGRPDVDLGWFGQCSEREALDENSWSYDPAIYGGTYFICKKHWPRAMTVDNLQVRQEIARFLGGQARRTRCRTPRPR